MDPRGPLRLFRAALVTSLAVSLAVAGHVLGGGQLPDTVTLAVTAALLLAPAAWLARRQLSFAALFGVLGAGQVTLPTATPFTSVSVKPIDGWTAKITEAALPAPVTVEGAKVTRAAATVTWTADTAHQLGQHEYQTFSISVGRLPEAGTTVAMPAAQTYSDGTVVNWNQPETGGQAEPELPVPSFVTTAAADEHSHAAPAASAAPAADTATGDTAADTASASSTAPVAAPDNTFGIVGLGAGLLGLAAGSAALVRTRKG
ncbi:YcnI family protein [Arthrobacter sp. K5]|uniref:YcnI family protein n=1 Tax=Arthrobacter sp. K5 TaxID=2839623 RepID=A0AAU8ELF1_9MICC